MISAIAPVEDLAHILTERLRGTVDEIAPLPVRAAHRMYTARWLPVGHAPLHIVIRFFQGLRAHEDMRHEAQALRDLYRVGLPVPELYLSVDEPGGAGAPFLVMEWLPGQPLGKVALANRERIPYWLDQASTLMLKLHGVHWQTSFDWLHPPLSYLEFADRQIKWWLRKAQAHHVEDAVQGFNWLRSTIYRVRAAKGMALVHRDLHPDNLLAQGDKITGILDWGELTIADPAVDVGWSRMILATEVGPELGDTFVEAYRRRNPDVAVTLTFWEVFAACKRLTTMALHEHASLERAPDAHLPVVNEAARLAAREFIRQRLTDEE